MTMYHKTLSGVVALSLLGASHALAETGKAFGVPFSAQKHLFGISEESGKSILAPVPPHCRAGNPQSIAWYARPSLNEHYCGGYVGGGAVHSGHARRPDEGTWGLDYTGALFKKHVWLQWWHGRRDQDGGGSYVTDGPPLIHH
jgi:hypothetical protein